MTKHPIPHRRKVMFIAMGAVALVVIGAGIGFVFLLSGAYSTSATKQHFAVTYRILDAGLRYSIAAYAEGIEVPAANERRNVQIGAACYQQHCVECHGAPGVARGDIGKGMLPLPSSLAQSARDWKTAHLYFVTRNGVRMTGMPAWEYRMSDDALWSTVFMVKMIPELSAAAYRELTHDVAGACPRPTEAVAYSTDRARILIQQYACAECHLMDGIVGSETFVGPALHDWRRRKLIAGVLPNTPENLVRWLVDPQAISPHTLMPDLDVSELHARDMSRYLFGDHE